MCLRCLKFPLRKKKKNSGAYYKWSQSEVKSEREKQVLYINAYIWNLEK